MADHRKPYGVGLGHRNIIHDQILAHRDEIDVLEIFCESYLVRQRRLRMDPDYRLLNEALEIFPCVSHGVGLSIGTVDPVDIQTLQNTRRFLERTGIHCHGEHLTFHKYNDIYFSFFLCMPFIDNSLDWLTAAYEVYRRTLGVEIALENVSYHFSPINSQYDEPDFLTALLERTNCSLLLDVTNVHNNCVNHNIDPVDYIRRIPADRVSMMHLAGGHYEKGFLVDSHSHPVMPEVWELFDVAMEHTNCNFAAIELDDNFQPFSRLMKDVRQAREIFYKHRPAECPDPPLQWDVKESSEDVELPDPNSAEFADLRNFQQALFTEITNDDFRAEIRKDRNNVIKRFPMSEVWQQRFEQCPAEQLDDLARLFRAADRFNKEDKAKYERSEWAAWARS